jgi:hypothetical protein
MMLIEADNNLENSDWIKARTWDLPYENLQQYLRAYEPADQRKAVQHLMSLPAFKAAPPVFRVEAEMFVAGSALKFVNGEFMPAVNTEQHDTIDGNARKVD